MQTAGGKRINARTLIVNKYIAVCVVLHQAKTANWPCNTRMHRWGKGKDARYNLRYKIIAILSRKITTRRVLFVYCKFFSPEVHYSIRFASRHVLCFSIQVHKLCSPLRTSRTLAGTKRGPKTQGASRKRTWQRGASVCAVCSLAFIVICNCDYRSFFFFIMGDLIEIQSVRQSWNTWRKRR